MNQGGTHLDVVVLVAEDGPEERQQRVQLGRGRLNLAVLVCVLNDLFDHAEDERTRVKVHVELLEELKDVLAWLGVDETIGTP